LARSRFRQRECWENGFEVANVPRNQATRTQSKSPDEHIGDGTAANLPVSFERNVP